MKSDLCALAISGGGIRSATFGLGVLQGLAQVGMLDRFDYLSTVSGGGYIGSWFSSWIRSEGFDKVVEGLKPDLGRKGTETEPEPIRHLRYYSNYLTPQPGFFSWDGRGLACIYLRNFLLNFAVLAMLTLGGFVFSSTDGQAHDEVAMRDVREMPLADDPGRITFRPHKKCPSNCLTVPQ